jgi:hypothetical protein
MNRNGRGLTREDRSIWAALKLKRQLPAPAYSGELTDADEEIMWDVMNRANFKPLTWAAFAND